MLKSRQKRDIIIVQTLEILDYAMTTRIEHDSVALASRTQTSDESSVQFDLLQESGEVTTVLQHTHQWETFPVTRCFDGNQIFEEGNKCFESDKYFGFLNEQHFALHESLNEITMYPMYQTLCHSVVTHDKPVKSKTRSETQTTNATFGR